MKLQRHLSIRRILVLVSLLFLLLPVGGIYFLRIYESALVRQTESELISQGAFVAALYQQEVKQLLAEKRVDPKQYGISLPREGRVSTGINPILPHLDLAQDRVYPVRPVPLFTRDTLDSVASKAGKKIIPVLKEGQRVTLSGIKILDHQGLVVAGEEERGLSFSHAQEFQQARMGRPVSLLRMRRMPASSASPASVSRNSSINVFVALPVILNERLIGVVWLNRTPIELSQALYSKRTELFWTAMILLLTTMLLILLTSLTITRPIRALVHKTRLIAQGDPEGLRPLEYPITREIAELSDNIAGMAQTIQHRSEYIQTFTTHVSHEFKTPLTAIRGSVELLQDHLDEMPKEQQQRFLSNIAEDTTRLSRLVSRLLELARADMIDAQADKTDLLPTLHALSQSYPIVLKLPEALKTLVVKISGESLQAVLSNLMENSKQAGADCINISVSVSGRQVLLNIHDNGPGISKANQHQIFTPFFTTRRDKGGTGLGLSITQSLLAPYGGQIVYQPSEVGAHFRIELTLL